MLVGKQDGLSQHEEGPIPATKDGPIERTGLLTRPSKDPTHQQTEDLKALKEQLAFETSPESFGVKRPGHEQDGNAQMPQPVIQALGNQEADEDPPPRSVLPAARIGQWQT